MPDDKGQLKKVLTCPNCGTRMEDRDAKRRCPKCNYMEDCCGY